MAILLECPMCHKKQKVKNKKCFCGADLDRLKRQKEKVKYWCDFQVPVMDNSGVTRFKQRREFVGYSIEKARDVDGKRRTQKREKRFFDMLPGTDLTFNELAVWYLNLEKVKEIRSYDRIRIGIKRFNEVFGHRLVNEIQNVDLENYQVMRSKKVKPRTVDYELSVAGTMVNKAFYNRKISDAAFLAFKSISNLVPLGSNARDRVCQYRRIYPLGRRSSGSYKTDNNNRV